MEWFQTIVLALIQGVTEFLPVSSSAHLILPSKLLNWEDQGLAFDVAVHLGTLAAVVTYFRDDLINITRSVYVALTTQQYDHHARLGLAVFVGVIPAGIFGVFFDEFIESNLRSVIVIATATVAFGVLLGVADKWAGCGKNMKDLNLMDALMVGGAQALALIPGTSRSGITITAALLLGFDRESSARFSFLLSIPIILSAGLFKAWGLVVSPVAVDWPSLVVGVAISWLSAYLCIGWFLNWLKRLGMQPFVIYRLVLGALLFGLILF